MLFFQITSSLINYIIQLFYLSRNLQSKEMPILYFIYPFFGEEYDFILYPRCSHSLLLRQGAFFLLILPTHINIEMIILLMSARKHLNSVNIDILWAVQDL